MTKLDEFSFVKQYLTHRELLGYSYPLKDMIEGIKQNVYAPGVLSVLSQLSYIDHYETSGKFKGDLLKVLLSMTAQVEHISPKSVQNINHKAKELLRERTLLFDQGLLNLWKFILLYANKTAAFTQGDPIESYRLALWMMVSFSDYYTTPGVSIKQEVFRNLAFNRTRDFGYTLARTLLIYTDICRDSERFDSSDFIDIGTAFEEKYGFSIEVYITFLFSLHAMFMSAIQSSDGLVGGPWARDITEVFKSTKLSKTCQETLKQLSFNVSDAREVLHDTLDNPWDFSFFYGRPILTLDNGLSFPVHRLLLENSLSELLFWTVRKCYPEKSRTFQSFFGRAFELYGQDVLQASCEASPFQL